MESRLAKSIHKMMDEQDHSNCAICKSRIDRFVNDSEYRANLYKAIGLYTIERMAKSGLPIENIKSSVDSFGRAIASDNADLFLKLLQSVKEDDEDAYLIDQAI